MNIRNSQKGFTLIELLVVIAIISLLSSVVFKSLSGIRAKSRIGAAQTTMRQLQSVLLTCMQDSQAIAIGINETSSTWQNSLVCTGGPRYPALPAGRTYCDGNAGTGCATASSQNTGTSFTISVYNSANSKTITCTDLRCTAT